MLLKKSLSWNDPKYETLSTAIVEARVVIIIMIIIIIIKTYQKEDYQYMPFDIFRFFEILVELEMSFFVGSRFLNVTTNDVFL